MGNAVFPTLPGLKWGTVKAPLHKTTVREATSGREYRWRNQAFPRYRYTLSYEVLRAATATAELQQLVGFFNARGGSYDSFLFQDPNDNAAVSQTFGLTDGVTTSWQLARTLGGFTEPVYDLNGDPTIYIDGQSANLVRNSSFEVYQTGVRPRGYSNYSNGGPLTAVVAVSGATGAQGMGVQVTTGSAGGRIGISGRSTYDAGTGGVVGGWRPFTTYTIQFKARKVNGAAMTGMNMLWNVAPASQVAVVNPNLTTTYQTYQFRITTGATVEGTGSFYLGTAGSVAFAVGDEVHFDDLIICRGDTAPVYVNEDQTYSVSASGVVTFNAALAAGRSISWSGSYYWRVRFERDSTEFVEMLRQLWEARQVNLITVKP